MDKFPYVVKPVPQIKGGAMTMKVTGQTQKWIQGDVANKDWPAAKDCIQLLYCQVATQGVLDAQSGLPSGERLHHGVEVVGRLCQAVPKLWQAHWHNENLTEVLIDHWSHQVKGTAANKTVNTYTLKLTNANIVSMDLTISENDGTMFFRMRLAFGKIEYNWHDGKIVAQDDWIDKVKH